MTVKDSGCHLVAEVSADLVARFLHRLFMGADEELTACELWPLPHRVFQLGERPEGGAIIFAIKEDGTRWEYGSGPALKDLLMASIEFRVGEAIAVGECRLPEDENNPGQTRRMTFQEKLDCILRDVLPRRQLSSGQGRPRSLTIAELGVLPPGVTIDDFEIRSLAGGTGLAFGIFFAGSGLAGQNKDRFRSSFSTDFLNGRNVALSASIELIDHFGISNPTAQRFLRSTGQLSEDVYTPHDPNRIAQLTAIPPDKLVIFGSGEFRTEDCDVDAEWFVVVGAWFDSNGVLNVRAEFDYDASEWDIFWCVVESVLIGASIGILLESFAVGVIGAIINFPSFSMPGDDGANITRCGDRCSLIRFANPHRQDGKFIFELGRDSLELKDTVISALDVALLGDMNVYMPPTELEIRDVRRSIHRRAESVCRDEGDPYTVAGFTLSNPHSPSQAEFLGYEWPVICSVEFPPKVPSASALSDFAEIALVGPNSATKFPFRVHGIHQQRVEVRVRQGATPANMQGSVIVRTNTPPFTRHVPINVDTSTGTGPIQVYPLSLAFEQRNEELVDLKSLRRRSQCGEAGPLSGRTVPLGGYFTVRNAGGGTLHVCDIAINDPNGVFEIRGPATFSLPPFTDTTVAVLLNDRAQINQHYTATISVQNTDPNQPQVDVAVSAVALDPPQNMTSGGVTVRVDNYWNAICLDLVRQGPDNAPIDLSGWTEIFTDPPSRRTGAVTIYDLCFLDVESHLEIAIESAREVAVQGTAGVQHGDLSLQLTPAQMGRMSLRRGQNVPVGRLRARSFRAYPVRSYAAHAPISAIHVIGKLAGLATGDELRIVSIKNPEKPRLIRIEQGTRLSLIRGNKKGAYGLSERGVESYTLDWKKRGVFAVDGAQGLAVNGIDDLVYVLGQQAITVVDFGHEGGPVALHRVALERPGSALLSIGNTLYLLDANALTSFDLSRPWRPTRAASIDVAEASGMSKWLGHVLVQIRSGTRMFALERGGKLVSVAFYRGGHWSDSFIAARHLLSLIPEGFTIWRIEQRHARSKAQG